MNRTFVLLGGLVAYVAFLASFVYLMAFMAGVWVPKAINTGDSGSWGRAFAINTLLAGIFALQHAVMARDAFKSRWKRIVPVALERSLFVLAASLALGLLFWQWQAIPTVVWDLEAPWLRVAAWCSFVLGIAIVLYTSFLIDHFDLFGLRQVWLHYRRRPYTHIPFSARSLYRWMRHPMMAGFLLTLWSAPTMTVGHLQFALLMTAYILVGIHMEERTLVRKLGKEYREYRERTPMLIPLPLSWRPWRLRERVPIASEGNMA
jgi:protein-S-isoprenylcysteine O-methyltransferase Ste14